MSDSTEVGFFGAKLNVTAAADMAAKMNESAQNDPRGGDGNSLYLNFSGKKGVYKIGPEARVIGNEEQWVVNIMSMEDGWVCWKGGRPAANRMSSIFGVKVPAPDTDEFGPFDNTRGEGWFQAKAVTVRSLDTDEQGYFKINSKSGVSAIAGIQREISDRQSAGMPCWPVVRLDSEEFESQGHKNEKPVFHIDGWLTNEHIMMISDPEVSIEDLLAASSGEGGEEEAAEEGQEEKKPATRRRRKL